MNALIKKIEANKTDGQRIDAMRKDVVETLKVSMGTIKTGSAEERKETVANLQQVRSELISLSKLTGHNSSDMVGALDTMIKNAETQVGLMRSIGRELRGDKEKTTLQKFASGFWNESSPFLKLAYGLAKDAKSKVQRIRDRADQANFNPEELEEAAQALKDGAKELPKVPKNANLPKITSPAPQPIPATPTPSPVPEKLPTAPPMPPAPIPVDRAEIEGPPKPKRIAQRDPETGQFAGDPDKPRAPKTVKEGVAKIDASMVQAIEKLSAAVDKRFSEPTSKEGSGDKESNNLLTAISGDLTEIKNLQQQTLNLAKQESLHGSKDRLRQKPAGKSIVAPSGKDGAKPTSLIGGAIQSMLGGLLGGILPGFVSTIAAGLVGLGKFTLKLLNPMNWVRGATAVFDALKPSNILKAAKGAAASITGIVTGAFTVFGNKAKAAGNVVVDGVRSVGGAVDKLKTFGKSILKPAAELGRVARTIPVVGQIITVGLALFDFFSGWNKAAEILGKDAAELTTWDKVSAGIGKAIGSIAGIIDSIAGLFGFDWNIEETVTKFLAKTIADIPENMKALGENAMKAFTSIKDSIMEWANWLIKGAVNAVAENIPGGKWLVDKISNTFGGSNTPPADQQTPAPIKATDDIPPVMSQPPKPGTTHAEQMAMLDAIDRPSSKLPEKTLEHERTMAEAEARKQQAATQVNNVDNRRSTTTNNTYQSTPLTTRNPDDSHRLGL